MPQDASHYECAVRYNEILAIQAESLALTLEDPVVAGWARSVAKQHRYHEQRHRRSLERAQKIERAKAKPKGKRRGNNRKGRYQKHSTIETASDFVLDPITNEAGVDTADSEVKEDEVI